MEKRKVIDHRGNVVTEAKPHNESAMSAQEKVEWQKAHGKELSQKEKAKT